jgi:hypothetical protein
MQPSEKKATNHHRQRAVSDTSSQLKSILFSIEEGEEIEVIENKGHSPFPLFCSSHSFKNTSLLHWFGSLNNTRFHHGVSSSLTNGKQISKLTPLQ